MSKAYKKVSLVLFFALIITIASAVVPRLGKPYICTSGAPDYGGARDERGIPLTYIYRSVGSTDGCYWNGTKVGANAQHQIIGINFIADAAFWAGILGIAAVYAPKLWRRL